MFLFFFFLFPARSQGYKCLHILLCMAIFTIISFFLSFFFFSLFHFSFFLFPFAFISLSLFTLSFFRSSFCQDSLFLSFLLSFFLAPPVFFISFLSSLVNKRRYTLSYTAALHGYSSIIDVWIRTNNQAK